MARPVRIAAAQYQLAVGDLEANRAAAVHWADRAGVAGAQLVVLPELASSGYVFQSEAEAEQLSESIDGPFTDALLAVARAYDLHVISGLNERGGDGRFNSAILVGPSGHVATYRKVQLFHDERSWFRAGDGLPIVDLPFGRVGMMICFDIWFPEVARALALAGAEIIAVPTNWVASFKRTVYDAQGYIQGNYMAIAAAAANGTVVACADRVGTERGTSFLGNSLIVGADGWPVAGPASASEPELLVADVDLDSVEAARQRTPRNHLLDDRREGAYRAELVDAPHRGVAPAS
ncbi:MAG: nitrilase-related carbon-nitrogen hydrolase [Candidatus Dormibacteria bacterium]